MQQQLTLFPLTFNYTTPNDIISASASSQVVEDNIKRYYPINVSEAMKQLSNVGSCLQLAYAGSKGFSCCAKVISILSSYQTMIKDSQLACQTFVNASLAALKFHVVALKLIDKDANNISKAIEIISKCEELAQKMEKAAESLVKDAEKLCASSVEALEAATNDETLTIQKKQEVKKAIALLQSRAKALKEKTQLLNQQVQEEKELEEKSRNQANQLRKDASYYATVSVFTRMLTLGIVGFEETQKNCEKQAEKMEQRESKAAETRRELQKQQIIENSELAESVEKLKNSSLEKNDLSTAINSLQVSVKALGKIKTIFENTRLFWQSVGMHCKDLQNNDIMKLYLQSDMTEDAINEIKLSGLNWLSLGKINFLSLESIKIVNNKVDNIMNDLPSQKESIILIKTISDSMLLQLEEENDQIKQIQNT